jgi:hypothetical protein
MKKQYLTIIALFTICALLLSLKSDNEGFYSELTSNLEQYNKKLPAEKIYVQLDKTLFKAGDYLWFKAYVAEINSISRVCNSNGLNVKIFDEGGQVLLEKKFVIKNNAANGALLLPKELADGIYTFIAYSSWMENDSADRVFRKFIEINNNQTNEINLSFKSTDAEFVAGNVYKTQVSLTFSDGKPVTDTKVKLLASDGKKNIFKTDKRTDINGQVMFENTLPVGLSSDFLFLTCESWVNGNLNRIKTVVKNKNDKYELKFYAEGGTLLNGIRTLMVVKANDSYNKPVQINGKVTDEKGNILANFKTNDLGYGNFRITVNKGAKLSATIINPSGIAKVYSLPEVKEDGISLALIRKQNDTIFMRLETPNKDTSLLKCTMQARGKMYWAASIAIVQKGLLKIPISEVPTGIAQVTIFNKTEEIVAQRLVYVENKNDATIESYTDKLDYPTRSLVTLNIKAKNISTQSVPLELSLSVVKANQMDNIENIGLKTAFLLNPEISSVIYHSPLDIDTLLKNNIDILLITNNLRYATWDQIKKIKPETEAFGSKDGISGLVFDPKGNPVAGSKVTVINNSTFTTFQIYSDKTGWFQSPVAETSYNNCSYKITAASKDSSIRNNVVIANKFEENLKLFILSNLSFVNPAYNFSGEFAKYQDNSSTILKQESMKLKDIETVNRNNMAEQRNKRNLLSPSKSLMEVIEEIKPYRLIGNKIIFLGYSNSIRSQGGAMFVIDGMLMGDDVSIANKISVTDIENIKVSTDLTEISKYTGFANGIIIIETKKGNTNPTTTNLLENRDVSGYEIPLQFNAPEYGSNNVQNPDNRTTLIWNPEITLNDKGEEAINFYTSDVKGKFVGIIEGIDGNGVPVKSKFYFTVK